MAVNKSQLVDAVGSAAALEKRQAERAVDAVMSTVIASVEAGMGRDPQTGTPVRTNASKGVWFAAGSASGMPSTPTDLSRRCGRGRR